MKQKILEELKKADSFERYHFEVDGQPFFVSRNIAPRSSFSYGFPGWSSALYGYPLGTQPDAEELAHKFVALRSQAIRNRQYRPF